MKQNVCQNRTSHSRVIWDSIFCDFQGQLQGHRKSNLIGAFDSQHTLSQYLSIQTVCLSRSVWPLEAVEVSSVNIDHKIDLGGQFPDVVWSEAKVDRRPIETTKTNSSKRSHHSLAIQPHHFFLLHANSAHSTKVLLLAKCVYKLKKYQLVANFNMPKKFNTH